MLGSEILILKNGKKLIVDHVKLKPNKNVEYTIGKQINEIKFFEIKSIISQKEQNLPHKTSLSNRKKTNQSIIPVYSNIYNYHNSAIETSLIRSEGSNEHEIKDQDSNFFMTRTGKFFQSIIPGWSPMIISNDSLESSLGVVTSISEIFLMYKGIEFFDEPKKYVTNFGPSTEARFDYITYSIISGNLKSPLPVIYFNYTGQQMIVTSQNNILEESTFYHNRNLYASALIATIAIDIGLSQYFHHSAIPKSIHITNTDGGHSTLITLNWIF